MAATAEQRILLIEDDEEQAILVQSLLPPHRGYDVHWVASASAALRALESSTYHAALVDLSLGGERGVPLIAELRAAGVPAIVLTGDDSAESDRQALEAGAADYLVKGEVTAGTIGRALRYTVERERTRALLEQREQSLRQLAAERAHLAAIVQSSGDAIHSVTLDGVVLSWNAAAERLYGFTAAEMLGRSLTLLEPDDRRGENARLLALMPGGHSVQHYRSVHCRRDGRRVHVSLTMSRVDDESGAGGRTVSTIVREVTEQRRP